MSDAKPAVVVVTDSYLVAGLTCRRCTEAVADSLRRMPSVTSVRVDLVPDGLSTVTVTSEHRHHRVDIAYAVDEVGCHLVS